MKEANCPNNILHSIFSQRKKVELTGERKCQVYSRCPTNNTLFWKWILVAWENKYNGSIMIRCVKRYWTTNYCKEAMLANITSKNGVCIGKCI